MTIHHAKSSKAKRVLRVRAKVRGTAERPRLTVFRSNRSIYLQAIDDQKGRTIAAANSMEVKGTKMEQAKTTAANLAEKLKKAKVSKLVFDRGSYKYHGRVKAVAETMREQGMQV
jgi:large subunit ribosomal protein L18